MPQLIRTPDEIFREEGKDIYFIRFFVGEDEDILFADPEDSLARKEMQIWLAENIPAARVECLAPSDGSGWVGGYFGSLRVDFSESDLAKYCARWEDADGKSLDPRFQCYQMLYKTWFEKISQFVPTIERPAELGLTRWWDTPIGFIYHQLNTDDAAKNRK